MINLQFKVNSWIELFYNGAIKRLAREATVGIAPGSKCQVPRVWQNNHMHAKSVWQWKLMAQIWGQVGLIACCPAAIWLAVCQVDYCCCCCCCCCLQKLLFLLEKTANLTEVTMNNVHHLLRDTFESRPFDKNLENTSEPTSCRISLKTKSNSIHYVQSKQWQKYQSYTWIFHGIQKKVYLNVHMKRLAEWEWNFCERE